MSDPTLPPPEDQPVAPLPSDPATDLPPVAHVKPTLYQKVTGSLPLLVTVIVHAVLFLVAGAYVVTETIMGEKKAFETPPASDANNRQVEHRLQVARRGGSAGGSSSPIAANRITTSAEGALQLPEMPALPSMGAGGFGGFGGLSGGVGINAGGGMNTSIGGGGLGGRGLMSLSFLGMTNQNVQKVVFVVDVNRATMDVRRGGFQGFARIREEMMQLVANLSPGAEFNVILFDQDSYNLFSRELTPATTANKEAFQSWMTPVNADFQRLGVSSAPRRIAWRPRPLPENSGIDPDFQPPFWARATRAAFEMNPDTIYVITGGRGTARTRISETELQRRIATRDRTRAELERQGIDWQAVSRARNAAYAKARREMDDANRRLASQGKDPIIIRYNEEITARHIQDALRRNGVTITLDREGWHDAQGRPIDVERAQNIITHEDVNWQRDFIPYMLRLQRALVPDRVSLNIVLFVGTSTPTQTTVNDLSAVARRLNGNFRALSNRDLGL